MARGGAAPRRSTDSMEASLLISSPERIEGPAAQALGRSVAAAAAQDLSIIVVTWNSERWIDRCLRSIPAACEGLAYQVVLWDNSRDNIGFAAAVNRAMQSATGEFVFLLNPDCELGSKTVTLLVDFLRTHPGVAAAAPLLEDEQGG